LETLDLVNPSVREKYFKKVKTWICLTGTLRVQLARNFFQKMPQGVRLVHVYGVDEGLDALSYHAYKSSSEFKNIEYYKLLPTGCYCYNQPPYYAVH